MEWEEFSLSITFGLNIDLIHRTCGQTIEPADDSALSGLVRAAREHEEVCRGE